MPFTVSHVAAALPFLRTPLPAAGLVIGTMAPDLPYFFPAPTLRNLTHQPLGIVTIDLAIGLLAWLVWRLVRTPVVALGPRWFRTRFGRAATAPWQAGVRWWRVLLLLVGALVLGSATHLLIDAPTHPGWLSQRVPLLAVTVHGTIVSRWLQEVLSLVLGIVLAVWTWAWVRRTEPRKDPAPGLDALRVALWSGVAVAFLVAVGIAWGIPIADGTRPLDPITTFRVARVSIGVALAASALACVAVAVAAKVRRA